MLLIPVDLLLSCPSIFTEHRFAKGQVSQRKDAPEDRCPGGHGSFGTTWCHKHGVISKLCVDGDAVERPPADLSEAAGPVCLRWSSVVYNAGTHHEGIDH